MNPNKKEELVQLKHWANMSSDPMHYDGFVCDKCIRQYERVKDQTMGIDDAVRKSLFPEYLKLGCTGAKPVCEKFRELKLTDRYGWSGPSRLFNDIVLMNRNLVQLDKEVSENHTFRRFSLLRRRVCGLICSQCFTVDSEFGEKSTLNLNEYKPDHVCPSLQRKRHLSDSILLESDTFFDADSFLAPTVPTSSSDGKDICEKRMVFNDSELKLKLILECQEQDLTRQELCKHKQVCFCRYGTNGLSEKNIGKFASLIWGMMKKAGAATALVASINKDMKETSLADHGFTKIRSNVTVKNVDVFGIEGSPHFHLVHKNPNHVDRRKAEISVALSLREIKLLGGCGQSMNEIKRMIQRLHQFDISTPVGALENIRQERKQLSKMVENVVISNVVRRLKGLKGNSHLVRFKNDDLLEFLSKYMYDKNGKKKEFLNDCVSLTLMSDHGKTSLKQVLSFNVPNWKYSADEAILLVDAKCSEDEASMKLLMESSHPVLLQSFSMSLGVPLFITGDMKNLAILLGLQGASSQFPCPLCKISRKTKIDTSASKGDKTKNLPSDRNKTIVDYDGFYDERISREQRRKVTDWNDESLKLSPLNPAVKYILETSKLDYIDELFVVPALHLKLSWNKMFKHSIEARKWIYNYHSKESKNELEEYEKVKVANCKLIESTVYDIRPKRHGVGGQLDADFTGGDISTILQRSEMVLKSLLARQEQESIDLSHAIGFFRKTLISTRFII